jgi:hypothetical protein
MCREAIRSIQWLPGLVTPDPFLRGGPLDGMFVFFEVQDPRFVPNAMKGQRFGPNLTHGPP